MRNTYEKRKVQYNSLVRPDGKPLNDQDKLILDLLIHFTKNKKIGTTTYEYLLNKKFPNKTSKKTVNRTLKNISLYIYAKFKNKIIIDEITYKDKIVFCRVADFEERMSTSTSKPCNNGGREGWTQKNVGVDKPQNEGWTKTRVDTSHKAEEQADLEGWTQENVGVDKKSLGVDKNVHPHIEEGNIYSSLKEEYIISEEKEKSRKKKKNNPSEKMSSSISQAKNQKTEIAEKNPTAENSEEAAKTSYAFGGDKVLPESKKSSNEFVDGNLAVARKEAKPDTAIDWDDEIPWLAKGENDNTPSSLASNQCVETEQGVSEEDHYHLASAIPLPEIETPEFDTAKEQASEAEVTALSDVQEDSSTQVKQTLSSEDEDDAKWQDIRKFVLEKFKQKEELAYGILHNMTITAIRPNRIGLSFARDLGFSEEEKELLRSCLRDVYGPIIEMIISRPETDEDAEKDKVKVHLIAEDDKRLPEGLKKQFEQLGKSKEVTPEKEEQTEELIEPDEVRLANKEAATDLEAEVFDHPLAYAKHKWSDVRQGIIDGIYGFYTEQMENNLSNVEVIGMTGRVLRLEAWWFTCDKMRDQQDLVERVAKKHDVDLEIKNREDGDVLYMPWTYPSHELPPLELDLILKKVN